MSLKDHWDKVQEATAKCKIEEVEASNLDKVMAVAAFTHSMRRIHLIAQIWEKNKTHAEPEAWRPNKSWRNEKEGSTHGERWWQNPSYGKNWTSGCHNQKTKIMQIGEKQIGNRKEVP